MNFNDLLNFDYTEYLPMELLEDIPIALIVAMIIGAVFAFIVLGMISKRLLLRRFVKKHRRLAKKKFNGELLLDKIANKRKSEENTYKQLRGSAKKKVKKYFDFKVKQLYFTAMQASKTTFRIKRKRCLIKIVDVERGKEKRENYDSAKLFIKLSNKYSCLDELILFLDELPAYILEKQDFEYKIEESGTLLTYEIR